MRKLIKYAHIPAFKNSKICNNKFFIVYVKNSGGYEGGGGPPLEPLFLYHKIELKK